MNTFKKISISFRKSQYRNKYNNAIKKFQFIYLLLMEDCYMKHYIIIYKMVENCF